MILVENFLSAVPFVTCVGLDVVGLTTAVSSLGPVELMRVLKGFIDTQ